MFVHELWLLIYGAVEIKVSGGIPWPFHRVYPFTGLDYWTGTLDLVLHILNFLLSLNVKETFSLLLV